MIHFYSCKDLKQTVEYWKRFDLKIYMHQPNTVIFDSNEGMIGFVERKNHQNPVYSCVSFVYETKEEVDRLYKIFQAEALGFPAIHPTAPVYSFFMKDPNGIMVEFQQFIER